MVLMGTRLVGTWVRSSLGLHGSCRSRCLGESQANGGERHD